MKNWILIFALITHVLFLVEAQVPSVHPEWEQASIIRYPDADVVILEDISRIRYKTDGTYTYSGELRVKVLTEKGRQETSSVTLGFDAAYGSVQFIQADIIKPEGRIVGIDLETQTCEAISAGQMNANIYDPNHKIVQLNVPDLKIGDILSYSYEGERIKTVVPNSFSDGFTLEKSNPIVHATYEINAPAELPLAHITFRDKIPGTVHSTEEKMGNRILYRWKAQQVPQFFVEPKMPSPRTVVQRILISTISTWESLSKWYWELSKSRLEDTTPEMAAKVRELTHGLLDPQEQIDAIFRFVSQEIRYMGITLEDEAPGYEPHDVSLTFHNRYGVCRDKAALLVSMLRLAGFDAYPVLIYVGPKKDPEVPQPWFNHAITAVRNEDGSYQLMDATNENSRDLFPAYLSDCSYLVAHPNGETLQTSPIIPPEKNQLTLEVDVTLEDRNRMVAEAILSFDGINDTAYRGRIARLKSDEREPYFEDRLKQALGHVTLTHLEITPTEVRDTTVPLSITLRFELEEALITGTDQSLLHVPTLINHFGLFGTLLGNGTGLDQRRFPLKTGITCGISETVRLNLRKSTLRPVVLPEYQTVDTPELFIRRSIESTNGQLISHADLMLRTVEFTPTQYLELKKHLKTAEQNGRKRVVLEPSGFSASADLATLEETVEYSIYDSTHWKKERTVRQKVLTYAGKKKASDLKIAYNSAHQTIVLNQAKIIAPSGSIHTIDPEKEIHIMDASWVSDAPRYPAEKILVASLPGVEIGSVIETKTTSLYRDLPFFSVTEHFADHNPIVQKTVRLRMPHRMKMNIGNGARDRIRRRTSHDGDLVLHEWSIKNQPMIKKEDHLPPRSIISPTLFLSTGNMKDYAKTVEKALRKAAKKNDKSSDKAHELTRGSHARLEKMICLRNFVDRTIRAVGPGFSSLPLSAITPADQILLEGYGNTTDRAVLLYALCEAAKLKPRFVLSSSLPRIHKASSPLIDTFQRTPFDTLLVAIPDGNKVYYLGDNGQYAQPGAVAHEERPSINLETRELEIPQSSMTNSTETTVIIDLAETGDVDLIQKTIFRGDAYEGFHKTFVEFTPEQRQRETQNILSRISQSTEVIGELRTSYSYPGSIEFASRIPAYAVRENHHLYLTLPGGLGNLLHLKSSQRDNVFYIESPIRKTFLYEINLPPDWKPLLIPESFRINLPSGAGSVEVSTGMMNGKLLVRQHAELNPALLSVEDYDILLELNNQLTKPASRTLLLHK